MKYYIFQKSFDYIKGRTEYDPIKINKTTSGIEYFYECENNIQSFFDSKYEAELIVEKFKKFNLIIFSEEEVTILNII